MRARDEPERSVELTDVIEKDVQVEGERRGHAVLRVVGGEIVVPLPDLALEGGLGVDLDLLDVELVAQELEGRLDQPRMPHHQLEARVPQMQPHGGADL